jgi:hypothetical protein
LVLTLLGFSMVFDLVERLTEQTTGFWMVEKLLGRAKEFCLGEMLKETSKAFSKGLSYSVILTEIYWAWMSRAKASGSVMVWLLKVISMEFCWGGLLLALAKEFAMGEQSLATEKESYWDEKLWDSLLDYWTVLP